MFVVLVGSRWIQPFCVESGGWHEPAGLELIVWLGVDVCEKTIS